MGEIVMPVAGRGLASISGWQTRGISLSFPHRREGAFTFEVQHFELFAEYRSRGFIVQALTRRMVIAGDQLIELMRAQGGQVGLTRESAAHAADGVLDTALLPWRVRIAEIGCHVERSGKPMVVGEFGAIIEGDAAPQPRGKRSKLAQQFTGDRIGSLVGLAVGE